ncbi:MAG: DUF2852 domain-containing protein [Alphaproteobacteria bacterium]|nr:DUF2852 domain-containing protein [Alphaproteobacteria bacterium]
MSQSSTYENGPRGRPQAYVHVEAGRQDQAQDRRFRRTRWRPLEIAAVVLGFIVWWPLGLALLLWKLWRSKNGQSADLIDAARTLEEKVMHKWPEKARRWGCNARRDEPQQQPGWSAMKWGFSPSPTRATGNTAFDDWRDAELARLEEERRKLEAAEREFSGFIDNLRRARDREEFEQFMRARTAGAPGSTTAKPPD